jgi:hypothetical protein
LGFDCLDAGTKDFVFGLALGMAITAERFQKFNRRKPWVNVVSQMMDLQFLGFATAVPASEVVPLHDF